MTTRLIAAIALAWLVSGCAGTNSTAWQYSTNPENGGPPPSGPCQASG